MKKGNPRSLLPPLLLQGLPKDEKHNEGQVPRPIDIELTEDLVECCIPGDVVTVVGIVRVISGDVSGGQNKQRWCKILICFLFSF